MKIEDMGRNDQVIGRFIQETVPGKQITMAHVISSPDKIIYQKLGLDPKVDYEKAAIGILTSCPSETAVIAADIATKKANIDIGFIDRFSGTLIITGRISDVSAAWQAVLDYTEKTMGYTVCNITKV